MTTQLPDYYKPVFRRFLLFAGRLLVCGVIMGLISREVGRLIPFSEVPAGENLQVTLHMKILHGHIILTGCILPVIMCAMLYLAKQCDADDVPKEKLASIADLYIYGVMSVLLLLLVKGVQTEWLVHKNPNEAFESIEKRLLGGRGVRAILYTLTHLVWSAGILKFVVVLNRTLKRSKAT